MQYFVASLLTLLGLANSSQCTELNGSQNTWSGGPRVRLEVYPRIEEWPHPGPGKKLVLHKKNEPLNMTCTVVYQNGEKDDETMFDYTVDWKGPRHINSNPKIERGQSRNTAWIWFERLAEKDAGDYTCIAVSHKPWGHQTTLSVFFYLFVEHKPTYCGPQWFRCRSKHCIMERYVCDGKQDCEEGEDESPAAGCGLDPCFGKVLCADRCIPPEWCCDHRNCSGTFGLRGGGPWPHDNNEISYVQTAFYTVIGCAMAFMFIVTILVIAICRVQIKRAMNSRCSQQNRDVICGRRAVPLYDLDVYLNRNTDANYPGGVSIMCNINSGVQFVGRPAEPPPYSEVVAEPPREGPPPPYVSCENLIVRVPNPRFLENTVVEVASCRNMGEASDANQPDTDIRSGTNGNRRENSVPNLPGPQVPTYSYLSQGRTIVNRDTDPLTYRRITNSLYSRNSVDASTVCSEIATRNQPSTNFELEYVETDALLTDNSNNCSTSEGDCSKEAATPWKPYKCNALVGSLWLNNERRDKRLDKNWYRQTIGKAMKEFSGRETSSHKDSENEGVFLDTDQHESIQTITNNIVGNDTSNGSSSSSPANILDSVASRDSDDKNVVASCSNSTTNSEGIPSFSVANKHRRECITPEGRDDLEIAGETNRKKTETKMLGQKKIKGEDDHSGKKTSSARNSRSRTKKQASLTNGEASSENLSDTSVCAVAESGENLPNPNDDQTNTKIRQSSLVLPLRESFIGIQRDS